MTIEKLATELVNIQCDCWVLLSRKGFKVTMVHEASGESGSATHERLDIAITEARVALTDRIFALGVELVRDGGTVQEVSKLLYPDETAHFRAVD